MRRVYLFPVPMTEEHEYYLVFAATTPFLGALTGNKTDKSDFTVHILFVSINDTFCGIVLF